MTRLLLICFLALSIVATAQKDMPTADDNYQKYLDDGKNSDADADVRLVITSLLPGFLDLVYEQRINHTYSVELGGAYKFRDGIDIYRLANDFENFPYEDTMTNGNGFSLSAKRYGGKEAISEITFQAITYRNRMNGFKSYKYNSQDIFYTFGFKYLLGKSISAQADFSAGVRLAKYSSNILGIDDVRKTGFYGGFGAGFGYYIKY